MIDNIMNDDKTIAGGGKDMILAGRYCSPSAWGWHGWLRDGH